MLGIILDSAMADAAQSVPSVFDLSAPDAAAIGAAVAGAVLTFLGLRKGDEAKKVVPPEPSMALIGGAIVDRDVLRDLTLEVRGLKEAIRDAVDSGERRTHDRMTAILEDLARKVDDMNRTDR